MSEVTRNEEGQVVVTPQMILNDLDNSLTRDEIQTKYGLTKTDITKMFKHPDLKGRKTKKKAGFVWGSEDAVASSPGETFHETPMEENDVSSDLTESPTEPEVSNSLFQ